jgi:hypothetical protein
VVVVVVVDVVSQPSSLSLAEQQRPKTQRRLESAIKRLCVVKHGSSRSTPVSTYIHTFFVFVEVDVDEIIAVLEEKNVVEISRMVIESSKRKSPGYEVGCVSFFSQYFCAKCFKFKG